MIDVQNRARPCGSVALQIFSQKVNSSEICDHFLAGSDAVRVDLDRIPPERWTVDDVCTQDRWETVELAERRFVQVVVVALTSWVVVRLCVRKVPTRTTKQPIEGLQHRDSQEGRSIGANDRKQNLKEDFDIPLEACSLNHSF